MVFKLFFRYIYHVSPVKQGGWIYEKIIYTD
jgi:hypothetical protein